MIFTWVLSWSECLTFRRVFSIMMQKNLFFVGFLKHRGFAMAPKYSTGLRPQADQSNRAYWPLGGPNIQYQGVPERENMKKIHGKTYVKKSIKNPVNIMWKSCKSHLKVIRNSSKNHPRPTRVTEHTYIHAYKHVCIFLIYIYIYMCVSVLCLYEIQLIFDWILIKFNWILINV